MFNPREHLIKVQGGREYLPVAWRLVWFREAYPDWGIHTSIYHLDLERQIAICRAEILDAADRIVATATKREDIEGFPDYIEKAETGAIGRALALCGFGTQFAPELEEADRLADAPAPGNGKPAPPVTNPQTVPKPAPGAQSAPKPITVPASTPANPTPAEVPPKPAGTGATVKPAGCSCPGSKQHYPNNPACSLNAVADQTEESDAPRCAQCGAPFALVDLGYVETCRQTGKRALCATCQTSVIK